MMISQTRYWKSYAVVLASLYIAISKIKIFCILARKTQRESNDREFHDTISTNMNLNHFKEENESNGITIVRDQCKKPMSHKDHMLQLALEWDCLEVAKNSIIKGFIDNIGVSNS